MNRVLSAIWYSSYVEYMDQFRNFVYILQDLIFQNQTKHIIVGEYETTSMVGYDKCYRLINDYVNWRNRRS
jgi:hypothetical protein